jgi:hypothetical protein
MIRRAESAENQRKTGRSQREISEKSARNQRKVVALSEERSVVDTDVPEGEKGGDVTAPPAATGGQWGAMWILLLGAFMGFLDIFIVNVANPSIQAEMNASFADIQLVPTGYTLLRRGSRRGGQAR